MPNEVEVFKIVDMDGDTVKTLFHGNHGSRTIPVGKWVRADSKTVHDGSSGTPYRSGWHVFTQLEDAHTYVGKFTNLEPKAIVRCRARALWPKAHSPSPVLLTEHLLVEEVVWRYTSS